MKSHQSSCIKESVIGGALVSILIIFLFYANAGSYISAGPGSQTHSTVEGQSRVTVHSLQGSARTTIHQSTINMSTSNQSATSSSFTAGYGCMQYVSPSAGSLLFHCDPILSKFESVLATGKYTKIIPVTRAPTFVDANCNKGLKMQASALESIAVNNTDIFTMPKFSVHLSIQSGELGRHQWFHYFLY